MKNIIERIAGGAKIARYLPKAVSTRLAVAALAALAATSALAYSPKATVVWNGDFGTTTKTGRDGNTYTFTLNPEGNSGENLNTLSGGTDGNVIIGSGATYGAKVSWDADNTSDTIASVIIKYSSLAVTTKNTTPVLASVSALQYQNNAATITARIDDCVAVKTARGSKLTGRYANGSNQNYGGEVADIIEPSGYILMVFKSASAFQFWTSSDGSTWSGGTATGLTFGSTYPTAVGLGGKSGIDSNNGQIPTAGMTIEAVAIFRGVELSTTQVANNKLFFNSTAYENWAYANEVYTWVPAKDSSDIGSSNNGTLYQFSIYSGEDTSVTYVSGGNNWNQFCIGQTQYSAPGCALRFTSSSAGKTFTGGFSPFTFGGIIVESDAGGLSIGTASDGRTTVFGAASGDTETWFGFDADASVIRSGAFRFSGNVNLDIANGKTLSLAAADSPAIVASVNDKNMATTAGGTLKMHGLGKMSVSTLFATGGATLDFSDVQESESVNRSTTPFIQGNLTIDTTTKFAFPAGLAKDTSYKLCSGTLSGPSENIADIMVGTTLKKNVPLTFSGNSVSYGDSVYAATVDGSAFTWDAEEPESLDGIKVVFAGSGTVTGLSGTGTTISTTDNVTVDVTSFTSPTLFGTGTYRWTSGYPTTIPSAEYSYEYVGGATEATKVTVSDVLTINGNLKTSGYIALTGANTLAAGGSLEVLSDKTELAAVQGVQANGWSGGLGGTITVDANAELASLTTDALTRGGSVVNINVYGTLNLGTTRWTMQSSLYHRLNLHGNAEVKGSGDGNGILDFQNENASYANINVYDGTPTISGPIKFRAKTITWIEANAKLAVTGGTIENAAFAKSGAGTLSFSAVAPSTSGGLSASAGTIELDNISYTAGTITLSSAQNSPTLKMIATDAATTVSATVNVPVNTRGQLAFEGAGTFALSGPNTNGSIVWLGTNPVPGTLQLNGNVTINNGAVNNNYRFNKLGSGSSTLSLSAWSTCYDKDGNPGLGYTFDTIDADSFTGTIALSNSATDSRAGCTMNFSAVNIIKSSAVYGTPLVKVTKAVGARTDSYSNAINVSATQFNGNPAEFVYDDSVVGSEGIYLAEASYNGVNYTTLAAAVSDAKAASADPSAITVYNASATVPSGYALVTAAGGAMTLRSAGNGGLIYWAADNSGDWSGEASNGTHTFYTAAGGTSTTPYVSGDTVVFTSDTQIWSKTAAHGAKFQIGTDTAQAEVHFTRSGENCNDYILDGSTIEIKSGSTLVAERYSYSESTQAYTAWDSYQNEHPDATAINNTTISGAGTLKIGGDTGGHGAAAAILSGTTSISCAIDLADGATLTVPSGCTVTVPTTSVADKMVAYSTDSETGTKTYSVVPTVARLVNGETETPYADIMTALGNLIQVLIANPAAYVQVLDGTAELANEYGAYGIGLDASTRRYVKAVAISGIAGYTTVQAAIDAVANEGSVTLKADCNDVLTLADGKTVTIVAKVGNDTYTYTSPVAATPSSYRVIAGETVDGATTFTSKMFYTVTIPAGVEHASATVNSDAVAGGASVQVDAGSNVTIAWTAASGYKITSGATQTINDIAENVTATAPTVEAMGATVSDVSFSYGADYATATVTATVSGDATSATLSYGNTTYDANVVNGTVTFENVAVTRGNDIYAPADYTIAVKDGETAVTTTGGSGTTVAANVVAAGWINENATTHGQQAAGGSWTNAEAVTYSEGKAAITDNRFEATTASTASRVVLEFNVCFSSVSDADVDGTAQAAIKIGEVESAATFMVLAQGGSWTPVSNDALTPNPAATYKVVLTIDYGTGSYGVTVGDNALTNATGSASFPLAANKKSVQSIDFAGSGTLTSMKGDQVEGYMVKDNAGHWYATIQEATQAYSSANGPYTVLHSGTAPSGWSIVSEGGIDILKKLAKGFFFMAY